jgi:uncharacterized membrane protein
MLKSTHKGFAENLLFALVIFIVFLLIAGDSVVIPTWLQPVGRLHPLILHFPIVVLIMAVLMEFFRFTERFKTERLFQDIATLLWLTGAIFAAVTVIMGLFLSKEPGYEGATLQWHKWFGVSIVFVSGFIYWCRSAKWYNLKIARFGSVMIVACLVVAGDFGADLTHGVNFVLAPVWHPEKEKVPIDQALVFRDVVQPVFQSKCISCHNPNKIKGGLMLIDEQALLKGGKDGKLFIAGQPQLSLLLQRIHLPDGDEKHMPPSGKPQLTVDEMNLLYLWIKGNADFKQKVIDLPANDSLRVLAASYLKPVEVTGEKYDFAAADAQLIKKLNTNYVVIYPVAQGSPALGVNIYNKSTYQPKVLEGLADIKKQVVSLDLNKMPVKDAELKTIAGFENLRTLYLNFTDVTGNTLHELARLKYLKNLSLAGTQLNPQALNQLSQIKGLQKVSLWDTGLPETEIAALKKSNKNVEFITGYKDNGKPIKLNLPQVNNTGFVFTKPVPLLLSHPIKGVDIRYTTDGTDPDSVKSMLYKPGTMIAQKTPIKAKAYKPGWIGSDILQFNFYKSSYTPDSISFIAGPNEKYSGDGAKTLIDKDLGGTSFGNGKWIGSQKDLVVYMHFNNPISLHTVTLNCMRNTGSQIFLPVGVEVWGGADEAHLKLLSKVNPAPALKDDPFALKGMDCKLAANSALSCLKIIAKPIQKLPSWDPVKNQPGWVFVDEIFLN